jgi:hypothetical protein
MEQPHMGCVLRIVEHTAGVVTIQFSTYGILVGELDELRRPIHHREIPSIKFTTQI